MLEKIYNKIFIFGIITIFILVFFPQNILAIETEIDNEEHENYQDDPINDIEKGEWKTNYFCRIRVWVYGWCEPELGIGFIRNAELWGYAGSCRISGLNGTDVIKGDYKEIELKVQYLFGYTHFRFQGFNSEATIRGFALICKYKV